MVIKLLYKYLKYDVDQLTHRYANARITDPELQNKADTTGEEESNSNLVMRWIETGEGKLRSLLREYLGSTNADSDDTLNTSKSEWQFKFTKINSHTDGHALAELMHWFIVRFAMLEWAKAFTPNDASVERTDLEETELKLKTLLEDSDMPTKERKEMWHDYDDELVISYGA